MSSKWIGQDRRKPFLDQNLSTSILGIEVTVHALLPSSDPRRICKPLSLDYPLSGPGWWFEPTTLQRSNRGELAQLAEQVKL